MFNLSLTACSFYLKVLNSRKNQSIICLNNEFSYYNRIDGSKKSDSIMDLFRKFFKDHSINSNNEDEKKTFHCEYDDSYFGETDHYLYTYAIIKSGNYGSASEIVDINTYETKYKQSAEESAVRPFYLFLVFPKENEKVIVQKGMLIFQNIGPFGVKTLTTKLIANYFSSMFGISIHFATVAPELFIRKVFIRENIKKLTMVKNHVSDDVADRRYLGYGSETRSIANLRFNNDTWQRIINAIHWCAKGRYNLFEFENDKYDTVKVNVAIGGKGRERTIDVHRLENLSIIEAIPDKIKMADGLPSEVMLLEHLKTVAFEYLSEMVLQIT